MSSLGAPYHLRTNKAIDRDIFFELLSKLQLPNNIKDYEYISLGGPMLEDLRTLHQSLGMKSLNSLEKNSATLSRQEFNKPFNCINCIKASTYEFINEFNPKAQNIIWLDYTGPSWRAQFNECHSLISKLNEYDILKITLNANPEVLSGKYDDEKLSSFKEKAAGPYTSENLSPNDITLMDRLAITLAGIIETVSQSALDLIEGLTLKPLTLFRYIDGRHQMLTITCIILPSQQDKAFKQLLEASMLTDWPHLAKNWKDIHEIAVPDLTPREKQAINQLLPLERGKINPDELPFKLHKNKAKNQKSLENYVKYYRYIPNFQRLAT